MTDPHAAAIARAVLAYLTDLDATVCHWWGTLTPAQRQAIAARCAEAATWAMMPPAGEGQADPAGSQPNTELIRERDEARAEIADLEAQVARWQQAFTALENEQLTPLRAEVRKLLMLGPVGTDCIWPRYGMAGMRLERYPAVAAVLRGEAGG